MDFALTNKTRGKIPNIPWRKIKRAILDENYNLSLVLTGDKTIRNINKRYLKKDRATTVLAFPLSADEGEIFLCLSYIKKEAKKGEVNFKFHIIRLFVHGLLHLNGLKHGEKMEKEENKIIRIYG